MPDLFLLTAGTSLVGDLIQPVATSTTGGIKEALPFIVPIVAGLAGLGIAWKLFKKFTGART